MDELDEIFEETLEETRVRSNDPRFYARVFTAIAKKQKKLFAKGGDNFKRVSSEEYDDLSRRLDRSRFQESTSVRNVLKTRRLANLLVNDQGEFNLTLSAKVIRHLTTHLTF